MEIRNGSKSINDNNGSKTDKRTCKWFYIFSCIFFTMLIVIAIVAAGFIFFKSDFSENSEVQERKVDSVGFCLPHVLINAEENKKTENQAICANRQPTKTCTTTTRYSKWAICIVLSVSIICLTVICIISMLLYTNYLKMKEKISLLEDLEKKISDKDFNLDCKNELCKTLPSTISEI